MPGREGEKVPAGTVLYKVLWEGFPPEIATWEEEDQIPCGEVDFVEQYEASLAEEEAEGEAEAEESEHTLSKHTLRAVCVCSESCVFQR